MGRRNGEMVRIYRGRSRGIDRQPESAKVLECTEKPIKKRG